jgi:hypothetical protein
LAEVLPALPTPGVGQLRTRRALDRASVEPDVAVDLDGGQGTTQQGIFGSATAQVVNGVVEGTLTVALFGPGQFTFNAQYVGSSVNVF